MPLILATRDYIICREDLPKNPKWVEQKYPYPYCWRPYELISEAAKAGVDSELYREARRIFWEMYWRWMGRYRRERPFPDVYEIVDGRVYDIPETEDIKNQIIGEIIISAFEVPGFIPEEAKRVSPAYRVYRYILKPAKALIRFLENIF